MSAFRRATRRGSGVAAALAAAHALSGPRSGCLPAQTSPTSGAIELRGNGLRAASRWEHGGSDNDDPEVDAQSFPESTPRDSRGDREQAWQQGLTTEVGLLSALHSLEESTGAVPVRRPNDFELRSLFHRCSTGSSLPFLLLLDG